MNTALVACLIFLGLTLTLRAEVVPAPTRLDVGKQECRGLSIRCEVEGFLPQVEALVSALETLGVRGVEWTDLAGPEVAVIFEKRGRHGPEGYAIRPGDGSLVVSAESPHGAARAAATLLQLARIEEGQVAWPMARIEDAPDQPFRCFMIDMGRNPHDPATLRRVIDAMWFYKVNFLQLHLTDDQLVSWPSRAYPKIHSDRAGWTWEEFKALEAYSQARGVTIIPEVDVPGHSTILRREYPEVFGETPTDLASTAEAQRGVEQLIDEFLAVFEATPYVHIGGDEAYGVPAEIQRDFVNRLNRHVTSHGRRAIVWEGPPLGRGENKISSDVIQMNWRTINVPAQEMLDAGYEVVNASWDPLYIVDHYPRTMFTAVDLQRCYGFEPQRFAHVNHEFPTFAKPHRTNSAKGILGFCMPWWEGRQENILKLCVPRLAAVASAAWNRKGESDFARYTERQARLLPRLETLMGQQPFEMPFADPQTQQDNLAFRAKVTPFTGASQPVFGPQRLTNGLADRFDHFLGYPTQPEPLEIVIDLGAVEKVARIVVHETAVGESHEVYQLTVSAGGRRYHQVGSAGKGSRGDRSFVEHRFEPRDVRFIRVSTRGCHGLTFPSFSRLTEVEAFGR